MVPPLSAQFPFIGRLSDEGRRALSRYPPTKVAGAKLLLSRGDEVNGAYFLVAGGLRVFYLTPEGREATLYRVEPGGTCLLALTSAFNDEPYPAWVESSPGGAAFVRVPSADFRRLIDAEPGFREFLFSVLSGRVFELMRTLEEAGSARVEQRLARLLLRRADAHGVVAWSQTRLASELGTAREVVSRGLRGLKLRRLVATSRGQVRLLARDELAALAEV